MTSTRETGQQSSVVAEDGTIIGWHSLGEGPGLIIVGGVLSTGLDYIDLGNALSDSFTVHLFDRRGRGLSGPQRPGHSIDDECNDLLAVTAATKAKYVFGHSFGGLVALETSTRAAVFDKTIVYEPGVPIPDGLRLEWLDDYERHLRGGDRRAAFTIMVRGAGFAPPQLNKMPFRCARFVLRLAVRGTRWATMEPLLDTNLVEHRIIESLATTGIERFRSIARPVVVLGGDQSPSFVARTASLLHATIANSTVETLATLDHAAPQEHATPIAEAIRRHLT